MITEYLIIGKKQYPMLLDETENSAMFESQTWNVYRGNELVGVVASSLFHPVLPEFMIHDGFRVYLQSKDNTEAEPIDIYALAKHGEDIDELSKIDNKNVIEESDIPVLEDSPDGRIMESAEAHQKVQEEQQHQGSIIHDAASPPIIETLKGQYESVHEISDIFGKTIEEVITFLTQEGSIVGFDAMVTMYEENFQRCIVMHEHDEHRDAREVEEEELRKEALSKLSDEEKRVLGIKD